MTSRHRVFWISLLTTFLSGIYNALSPFLSFWVISGGGGFSSVKFYRELFKVLWTAVTIGIIYVWFRMGKTADMKHDYRTHIKSMVASWVIYTVVLGALFLVVKDDMWLSSIHLALTQSVLSEYGSGAMMFSALTLGWLVEEKPVLLKEFNPVILRPVLIYNGVKLVQEILGGYLFYLLVTTSMSPRTMGTYTNVLGVIVFPIWIWYLVKLLSSGKTIKLKTDYSIVLFTLWVPKLATSMISRISQTVFNYFSYSVAPDYLDLLYDLSLNLINSTKGLMGLSFGLICFGYLNSRYFITDHDSQTSQ